MPATIERSLRGSRQARARSCNSASLARPSSAGAVTEALTTRPPSAVAAMPSRRSDLARGNSRIATRSPSCASFSGSSAKIFEHQAVQEPEQQDQDYGRDVDPAEIRENTPDRPQQRLGDPPKKVADCGDGAVVTVDDAESDQPAQDRLGDQKPDIDRDHRVDEAEEGVHMRENPGASGPMTVASPAGGRKSRRARVAPRAAGLGPRLTGSGTSTTVRGLREARWGRSSAGRASRSQCEGQGFDPPRLHQTRPIDQVPTFSARLQLRATAKPRCTPGRAIIASYQRFTLGKSARSTWWRSCRQAQPRIAKSAIEISPPAKSTSPSRRSRTP